MRYFTAFATGAFSIAILSAPHCATAAENFVQTPVPGGVLIVNQTNGQINYCVALYSSSNYTPFGKCAVIGSISNVDLVGNLKVQTPIASNLLGFITNVQTGEVVQCALTASADTGAPTGKCITLQAK